MSPLYQTLLITFISLQSLMVVLWLISVVRRDASIVDPFWGTGFVIVAWLACVFNAASAARPLLMVGMVTVWGLRLSGYLLIRNWHHGEDRRYAAMRAYHGARFPLVSLGTVFLLQGIILWFVSIPIQVGIVHGAGPQLNAFDLTGVSVWCIGLLFEAVGDWQLAMFKANPANADRVMDRGLWRYTRHPNYFGDFCVWWGLYLISISAGGWWTIGSPLLMSVLLMKVSGVTLLESTISERRPAYAAYRSRTNAFFPGPPKHP